MANGWFLYRFSSIYTLCENAKLLSESLHRLMGWLLGLFNDWLPLKESYIMLSILMSKTGDSIGRKWSSCFMATCSSLYRFIYFFFPLVECKAFHHSHFLDLLAYFWTYLLIDLKILSIGIFVGTKWWSCLVANYWSLYRLSSTFAYWENAKFFIIVPL